MDGRTFRQVLGKFFDAPGGVCLDARVQVELPNGEYWDLTTMQLLENAILGNNETHRILLKCQRPMYKMGKVIGKL